MSDYTWDGETLFVNTENGAKTYKPELMRQVIERQFRQVEQLTTERDQAQRLIVELRAASADARAGWDRECTKRQEAESEAAALREAAQAVATRVGQRFGSLCALCRVQFDGYIMPIDQNAVEHGKPHRDFCPMIALEAALNNPGAGAEWLGRFRAMEAVVDAARKVKHGDWGQVKLVHAMNDLRDALFNLDNPQEQNTEAGAYGSHERGEQRGREDSD